MWPRRPMQRKQGFDGRLITWYFGSRVCSWVNPSCPGTRSMISRQRGPTAPRGPSRRHARRPPGHP
ncbi:hypothetical protein B0T21DRAFT_360586 [Apiosordaria backusii]|uniref:Uncharacterized protein n=1 Tax=Apiosordaria backusii TaxID=314023 RepID=A0AA40K129_9PEZI|nr:hypothetical protein B0T21DRAFT_360586 [Apiosordaria backusii]